MIRSRHKLNKFNVESSVVQKSLFDWMRHLNLRFTINLEMKLCFEYYVLFEVTVIIEVVFAIIYTTAFKNRKHTECIDL